MQTDRRVSLDLELWLSAVRSHRPGRLDEAVVRVAPWPRRTLDGLLAEAADLPFVDPPLLKRALVLHADIAALYRDEEGYSLPSDGRASELVQDGNRVGSRGGTVHWRFGRRIAARLAPDDDVRLWYLASAAFLQSWNEYSELEPHLAAARERFPRDAALLLYEGSLHAVYAQTRVQHRLSSELAEGPRSGRIGDASAELRAAERMFEAALEIDPGLTEARIRLACARGLLGRHDLAAAELRGVVQGDLGALMNYDASLLLGREEEALGRAEQARRAFERAAALFPRAQSPRLGLSLLARAVGDKAAARSALEGLGTAEFSQEPWWSFDRRHQPDADELFAQMRQRLAP